MMNNLNNLSEVYSLLESDALKNKIISIDKNEMIEVKSIIHTKRSGNIRLIVFFTFLLLSCKNENITVFG